MIFVCSHSNCTLMTLFRNSMTRNLAQSHVGCAAISRESPAAKGRTQALCQACSISSRSQTHKWLSMSVKSTPRHSLTRLPEQMPWTTLQSFGCSRSDVIPTDGHALIWPLQNSFASCKLLCERTCASHRRRCVRVTRAEARVSLNLTMACTSISMRKTWCRVLLRESSSQDHKALL